MAEPSSSAPGGRRASPFPGVYSALPQKMRCFHRILRRGCKAVGPGDLVKLASGYLQALISHHNGGKPKGATKKRKKCQRSLADCYQHLKYWILAASTGL